MNGETARRLNAINREFYATVADAFDTTRGRAWPGWAHIPLPKVAGRPVRVLDCGCGNGRFGQFVAEKMANSQIEYVGMDYSPALLEHAREKLVVLPNLSATWIERDLVEQPLTADKAIAGGKFDLIGLFGVLHHIPGMEQRRALVSALAGQLALGGVFAFACWRFYEYERFRARAVAWPDDLASAVEAGDFLLDWREGQTAVRYCHYADDAEIDGLIEATGLRVLSRYRADGFNGSVNAYAVLTQD